MKKDGKKIILFIIILIAIDQFSKYLIRQDGGFYICNKGVAFGINVPELLFWVLWVIIFGVVIFYAFKNRAEIFYLSLIISGALSNMFDRLYAGCITDFIDLKIWPVFNLADAFITIGAILVIVKNLKSKSKKVEIKTNKK